MEDEGARSVFELSQSQLLQLRRACEQGQAQACSAFGAGLTADDSVKGKRIAKFLKKGCQLGDPNGCFALAGLQMEKRVPGNEEAAFQNTLTSCRMGLAEGCCQTGLMLFSGLGTKQNIQSGLGVLMQTCEKGNHGKSCFETGRIIASLADAGAIDKEKINATEKIRTYLRKACDFKYQEGCASLQEFEKQFPPSSDAVHEVDRILEAERGEQGGQEGKGQD
uniref:Beta-lactamase n=1 Tax=Guillardia theta TaxID=55529 RepID=A0A7S4PF88_GUITH